MPNNYLNIEKELNKLAVFRELLNDSVIMPLQEFLTGTERDSGKYCAFVHELYLKGGDLGKHLKSMVLESENPVVKMKSRGDSPPETMLLAMENELELFSRISKIEAELLAGAAGGNLPLFNNSYFDFKQEYLKRLSEISTRGYGIFAGCHMFTLGDKGRLTAVKNPDPQKLEWLTGYEHERRQLIINTKALLKGIPANNILLYGDAGTGKSSTVKALANEYRKEGLRLVEVRKNRLYLIPDLMETLSDNPLKFILFIDDLSFAEAGDDFTALKAILEGDISARPQNVVVYATSNRKNLVRENLETRLGSEVHASDSLEETASLSARFGLTVTFLKPDRELYAEIVENLANEYELNLRGSELIKLAEAHAIRSGGRSPRTAKQFVEYRKGLEAAAT